jgi:DNA recombination protein RmuC
MLPPIRPSRWSGHVIKLGEVPPMIVLVGFCIIGLCISVAYAARRAASANAAESQLTALREREAQWGEREAELRELQIEMRGRDEQLAAERKAREEKDGELDRVRKDRETDREKLADQSTEIKLLKEAIETFGKAQSDLATSTRDAANANQRIETTLLDWTRQIASPQGRGAFGELALLNQLTALGMLEGRDFEKQATAEAGGRQRVDFIVNLGDRVVAVDSKLANDPGLSGLSEALSAGDQDRLVEFGRKLRDHAKALAAKDYWKGLERSPSLTLMYVPIEGATHALAALSDFDATKFFNTHRVCVITPSQLALSLILIAEVSHAERKEEHIEELLSRGYTMAEAMAKFLDNYAKLGRKLSESVSAFNAGAAMTSTHGLVWQQVVKPLNELAPSSSIEPEIKELEPPRDDVIDLAERYRSTAEQMQSESDAA